MYILGLSFFYHDSAACLLKDGKIVAAAQEERFSRIKHDADFPRQAIEFCLKSAGISIADVQQIAYYEKPYAKFERIIFSHFNSWPRTPRVFIDMLNSWLGKKLRVPRIIRQESGFKGEIVFCRHHDSHAASSFFTSPFSEAAIVTVDGVGEWTTTAISVGKMSKVKRLKEIRFPHSLGLLYSAFTYYLGFEVNDGEYKVMGLAPYGQPKFLEKISELVTLLSDGSIRMNPRYFLYESGVAMCREDLWKTLFGFGPRKKSDPMEAYHKDLAASVQVFLEKALLSLCSHAKYFVGSENLCLSGGVALNCVANAKIRESGMFKNIHVFPAAGDSGGAVGAALYAWHQIHNKTRQVSTLESVSWGPQYSSGEIQEILQIANIPFQILSDEDLLTRVAHEIEEQKVIGWFQGRMEFGPRALGNRSILADARKKENWQKVNLKIKFRESFRPFAPAITAEAVKDYFDSSDESPFMLFTAKARNEKVPAVVHVDGSARIQTVTARQNQKFYHLLKKFENKTGVPVLINTSFNTSDMPIVCTPQNAIQCFLRSNMDILVMENIFVDRRDISWATTWT